MFEDLENMKPDRLNIALFNLGQIKRQASFLRHSVYVLKGSPKTYKGFSVSLDLFTLYTLVHVPSYNRDDIRMLKNLRSTFCL